MPNGRRHASETDLALLSEMIRESERVIDHQVKAMEELDDKSEQMISLGVAALAGGVALGLFVVNSRLELPSYRFLALMLAGGLLNFAALILFTGSYIGFQRHTEVHVGPRLSWIAGKSNDARWKLLDHYLSIIKDYPSYYEWNTRKLAASARRRVAGLYLLLGSVLAYAVALIYIMAKAIVIQG